MAESNYEDDEDSDMGAHLSIKDRRREAHTQAEQKRRDAIKKGYDFLQDLVPMCQNSDNSQSYKVSKATVLQKSVDYIHYMQNCKKKQEEEVAALKKEVVGMTILKLNYEQIVSAHQNQPGNQSRQVSDDVKFEVFRAVIDSLFQTFDLSVTMNNFAEVSGSVIQWVEEHCKPQILREIMCGVLQQLQQHEYASGIGVPVSNNAFPPHPNIFSSTHDQ
ncbi:Max-like protein X [Armadillidium nasatum]|uniref:Max-like protein X n=1 Tax=Armadillidium nasatum TaxID=96803 RepID=A0A5N5TKZ3_9CRUS|nr:Max-like protein X [Armadillidium nasatum]